MKKVLVVSANLNTINKASADDWKEMASDTQVQTLEDAYLVLQAHGVQWDIETGTKDALGEPLTIFYNDGERVAEYSLGLTELLMWDAPVSVLKSATVTVYNPPSTITGAWMIKAFGGRERGCDAAITMWEKTRGETQGKWGTLVDNLMQGRCVA